MFFRESKRLKSQKEQDTFNKFKQDIFDDGIPVSKTINKYFKTVKDLNTRYNIAYKNSTCQMVSEEVRSRLLKKKEPYETGEKLVCKSRLKLKKHVFNVNYEYNITAVEGKMITPSKAMTLPIHLIKKNFVHNYWKTCHATLLLRLTPL